MNTDVSGFFCELDAGVFEGKLGAILSKVAAAVIDQDRKGKVIISLDLERIGNSYQVNVEHTLKYSQPTERGTLTEDEKTATPMHVGTGGRMSQFPENQGQMFGKHGEAAPHMPEPTGDQ